MYFGKRYAIVISLLALGNSVSGSHLFHNPLSQRFSKHMGSLLLAKNYGGHFNYMPKRKITGLEVAPIVVAGGGTLSAPVVVATTVAVTTGLVIGELIATGESPTAQKIGDVACEIGDKVAKTVDDIWPEEIAKEKYEEDQKKRDENEAIWSARMDAIQRGDVFPPLYDTADKGKSNDKGGKSSDKGGKSNDKGDKSGDKGDKSKGDDKGDKERVQVTPEELAKAWQEIKQDYKYSPQTGSHHLQKGGTPVAPGIDEVWRDRTHKGIECNKNGKHMGELDPVTRQIYKDGVPGRKTGK